MNRLAIILFLAAFQAARGEDDRIADREAIRAHIDSIYQAFIHKDLPALGATHAEDWRGFLNGSTKMIRGIDQYMQAVGSLKGPYGMTSSNCGTSILSSRVTPRSPPSSATVR